MKLTVFSSKNYQTPLIVVIGQSNAVGVAPLASAPSEYQGTIPNAKIWNGSAFVNLVAGSSNQAADTSSFGCELSLARSTVGITGKVAHIVKHATSNTSLAVDWLPTGGAQYTAAIAKIDAAVAAMPSNFYLAGIVWVQGENDALSASATPSNNYQTNLTSLIANLRSRYAAYNPRVIPFSVVQLGYLNRNLYYYQDNVRDKQYATAAAMTKVTIAQTDDLGYNADVIHYNAPAQIAIGKRAASGIFNGVSYVENRPPAYANITYWADASTPNSCLQADNVTIATNGQGVRTLLGRQVSPLCNVTNSTTLQQPIVVTDQINGRQIIRFDGSNDQLLTSGINPSTQFGTTAGTTFLIQKYAVDKAATTLFINAGTNAIFNIANKWKDATPLDNIFYDFGNATTGRLTGTAPAGITGNFKVTEFERKSDNTAKVFVDRAQALSGSSSQTMASLTGTLRLGSDNTNFFNGDLVEIINYNKTLSDDEKNEVYSYINKKHGFNL
jgi:hypothetical protein